MFSNIKLEMAQTPNLEKLKYFVEINFLENTLDLYAEEKAWLKESDNPET